MNRKDVSTKTTYYGTPIEKLSRKELISALETAVKQIDSMSEANERTVNLLMALHRAGNKKPLTVDTRKYGGSLIND